MKTTAGIQLACLTLSLMMSASAFGYGSGGGSRKCKPPKISDTSPPASAVVAPGAAISFTASNARQSSITVTAKGVPVDVSISETKSGRLLVKGQLPESVREGYARIKIEAKSDSGCHASDGWLLKVSEEGAG